MKLGGANPVHILFAMLRERLNGTQKLPGIAMPSEVLQHIADTVHTAAPPSQAAGAAKSEHHVDLPDDDVSAVALARLRSKISFAAADGVNKLSQQESGRSWELGSADGTVSQPPTRPVPQAIHCEGATRFTPSADDISEAMDVLASLNYGHRQAMGRTRHEPEPGTGWQQTIMRAATILLGVSILVVALTGLPS